MDDPWICGSCGLFVIHEMVMIIMVIRIMVSNASLDVYIMMVMVKWITHQLKGKKYQT